MLHSPKNSKEFSTLSLSRKIFDTTMNVVMMIGIVPVIAAMNIHDLETWNRGFASIVLGILFCLVSLPLIPFLVVGLAASYLEDKLLP